MTIYLPKNSRSVVFNRPFWVEFGCLGFTKTELSLARRANFMFFLTFHFGTAIRETTVRTFDPREPEDGPEICFRWSEDGVNRPQDAPRELEDGSKWAPDDPKMVSTGPKMAAI